MERDQLTNWAWAACRISQDRDASNVAILNLMVEPEVEIIDKVANLLNASGYHVTLQAVRAAWGHCNTPTVRTGASVGTSVERNKGGRVDAALKQLEKKPHSQPKGAGTGMPSRPSFKSLTKREDDETGFASPVPPSPPGPWPQDQLEIEQRAEYPAA